MKKQIVTNLASNYALSFFGMALGFFLVPFLIVKLGKDLYGVIVLSESTIAFFEILTISVRQALSRHATFALSQNRLTEFVEYLSTSLRIFYFSAIMIVTLGTVIACYFPSMFRIPPGYGMQSQWNFFLIAVSFTLATLNIPHWSAIYAKQRFELINVSTSIGLIVRAACLFAFYSLAPKEHHSLTAYGFIYLLMTLGQNSLIYYWYRRLFPDLRLSTKLFRPEKIREILSFSMHSSLSRMSSMLYENAANILINVFWGPSMNAVYSVALKLPSICHKIFVEPTYTLTPTFTTLAARNDREKIEKLLFMYSKLLATTVYPLLWTLVLMSRSIIRAWVGPELSMAGELMPFYALPLFSTLPASFAGSVTNAFAKVKWPSFMSISAAVFNFVLCFVLGVVFDMKLFGIALAYVTTVLSMSLMFYPVYACRVAGVSVRRYYLESLAKPFVFSAVFIGGGLAAFELGRTEWLLEPRLFFFLVVLYAAYYLGAYRWLLSDFEKKHLRETADILLDLIRKSSGRSAVEDGSRDVQSAGDPVNAETIRLEKLEVRGDTLHYEFSSSLEVFRKHAFSVRYEGLAPDAPESVLLVPFAALAAPIAMAAGAELSMPSLDADFAESLDRCEAHWKRVFPKWNFGQYRLNTRRVRNASATGNASTMLFSGGLDSLSTYLHNRDRKPHLFSIIGADIPVSQAHFVAECREKLFDDFSRTEGVSLTYIHTDIRETADPAKLRKFSPGWYATVQFGLLLTGLTAPVSYGRFSKLIMASCSHHPDGPAPCGADPGVVRGLRWASTQVEDNLNQTPRVRKVAYLKNRPAMLRYLRVCWEQFEKLNCGRCKKCLRTICELLVNNVDPNLANFQVDERTLPELRKKLSSEFHLFFNGETPALNFWREIQQAIDLKNLEDRYGSKEFFRWLAGFEPLRKNESRLACRLLALSEKIQKVRPRKVGSYMKHLLSGTKR